MERKHRHILQVAQALKFHAQLPTQFWGECPTHHQSVTFTGIVFQNSI